MIIVTGGAGFIGSNIVKELNERGYDDIWVVDDLTQGEKFKNLADCNISDYLDKEDFLALVKDATNPQNIPFTHEISANELEEWRRSGAPTKNPPLPPFFKGGLGGITAIFHAGACSATTEWDGRFMMRNNYEYSKTLLHYCLTHTIPFIYASSAAVYGAGTVFQEQREYERPLNVYGYSKFQFDQYVRSLLPSVGSQVVGLRYFNVYGPREFHKGTMASVAWHNHQQVQREGMVKLFMGSDGYGPGEQRRDFVYVDDVVDVNLWFLEHPEKSGIFNVGTGRSQTFNELSQAVISWHKKGRIDYIPFPEHLIGRYQSFTEADITLLREAGYQGQFKSVEQGVKLYLDWLAQN